MKMLISALMLPVMISILMMSLLNMLSKKSFKDREKMSPFECGFDPKNLARLPFSLQFFLIAIIFIIFDVELTLFLPMVLIMETSKPALISTCIMAFMLILMFGLYHEQKQGSLNWMK
uniref:NADH-ubiquinone oxidoreductase chain 3 n=1 Tax=Scolytinae sp. BMNH 1274292 TaxID=2558040 RepID=A0A126TF83_9CUCU|nr:NADH dehydrogenase subunit 3 [Scolytinae sp. BMNH 1274292]